jgi:integrase/recombinase XerC
LLAYENDLKSFFDYTDSVYETTEPNQINSGIIRSWLVFLGEDEKLSASSINRKLSAIKSLFKFLKREGDIEVNPAAGVKALKATKRLPVFISESSMENLLDGISFEESDTPQRDKLIIELFYQTGMRLSELTGLTRKNVNEAQNTIKVLGKRNKERVIPVTRELMEGLSSYLLSTSGILVFEEEGEPLKHYKVQRMVKQYLSQVTTEAKRTPHVLRHTFATHMLNRGADLNTIKEILGHAGLAATQVYTHNSLDKLKSIYKQAHPRA